MPGSAGAGNIVYALRLRNTGPHACTILGLPQVRLLGAHGGALPTKVVRDPRFKRASPFLLLPNRTATAQARFSPDVPGKGEQVVGPCEPLARTMHVLAGGLSFVVPVRPPTRVCEHGRLSFTPYR